MGNLSYGFIFFHIIISVIGGFIAYLLINFLESDPDGELLDINAKIHIGDEYLEQGQQYEAYRYYFDAYQHARGESFFLYPDRKYYEMQYYLSVSSVKIGDFHFDSGRPDIAKEYYDSAYETTETFSHYEFFDADWPYYHGRAHIGLGDTFFQEGNFTKAQDRYSIAQKTFEKNYEEYKEDDYFNYYYSISFCGIGDSILKREEDVDRALHYYRRGYEIIKNIARNNKRNYDFQQQLAIFHSKFSHAYAKKSTETRGDISEYESLIKKAEIEFEKSNQIIKDYNKLSDDTE